MVVVVVVVVVASTPAQLCPTSGTHFCRRCSSMPWNRTARNISPRTQVRKRLLLPLQVVLSVVLSTLLRINGTYCQDSWTRTCATATSRPRSVVPINARAPGETTQLPQHCAQGKQNTLPVTSNHANKTLRPLILQHQSAGPGASACQPAQENWLRSPFRRHSPNMTLESPPKPRLVVINSTWTCMPWTERTGLALSRVTRHCQGCSRLSYHAQKPRSYCYCRSSQLLSPTPDLSMYPPRCESRDLDGPSTAGLLPQQGQNASCICLHLAGTQPLVKCQPACQHRGRLPMQHLTHAHASAAASMPETPTVDGPTGGDQPQRQKQPRSRFRPDGTRRRTAGEIEKRRPYVEFWKAYQARQAQQQQREQDPSSAEPASSSSTRRHSRGPQHFRIYTEEDQGEPTDGPWQETSAAQDNWQSYGWQEYEDEKSWDWQWSDRDSRAAWEEARQEWTDRPASRHKPVQRTGMARSDSPLHHPARGREARR